MKQNFFQAMFWLALVAAVILANVPQPKTPGTIDDKQLHMIGFTILAGLAALAYRNAPLLTIFIAMAILGALIEGLQGLAGLGRNASLGDWFADIAGAIAALSAIGVWRQVKRPERI